jgi:hypothetical protein
MTPEEVRNNLDSRVMVLIGEEIPSLRAGRIIAYRRSAESYDVLIAFDDILIKDWACENNAKEALADKVRSVPGELEIYNELLKLDNNHRKRYRFRNAIELTLIPVIEKVSYRKRSMFEYIE